MLIKKICKQCDKEFAIHDFDVKRGRGIYCSHECYWQFRAGEPLYGIRKRVTKTCPVCKQEFETGGRAGSKDKIFCSNECSNLARYRHGSKCNELNKDDCIYIAGFMDGEGSIIIYSRRENSFGIRVSIAQSQKGEAILKWIADVTGIGSIVKKLSINPKHSNSLHWQCNSEAAESLLLQILPYLKLKKEQAELALNFQNKLRTPELKAGRQWQINFREIMQSLNLRGCVSEA